MQPTKSLESYQQQAQTHQTMPSRQQTHTPSDPIPSHPPRRISKFTEIFTETRIVDPFNSPPPIYSTRHQDSQCYMAKSGAELAFSITLRQLSPSQIHTRNPVKKTANEGPFSRLAGWDEEDRAVQTTKGKVKGKKKEQGPFSRLAEWDYCEVENVAAETEEGKCKGKKGRIGRWIDRLLGL